MSAADAVEYAARRFGLAGTDMVRLGLGYAEELPGGPRLTVPFRDKDGIPRGYHARALAKDAQVRWYGPRSPEGRSWAEVAGFEGASGWNEALSCEGPGDALTGVAGGYDTLGIRGAGLATNPPAVAEVDEMVGDRLAVIAGDGDAAGRTFAANLAQGLLAHG